MNATSTLIKIDYYWQDVTQAKLTVYGEMRSIYITPNSIGYLNDNASKAKHKEDNSIKDVHYLQTTISYGCGINGTNYYEFYITHECYKRIIEFFNIV